MNAMTAPSSETRRPFLKNFFGLWLALAVFASPTLQAAEKAAAQNANSTAGKTEPKGDKMSAGKNPIVIIETSLGNIEAELYADKAPISTENFLKYADSGFFNGTVFHRVINDFMIQGGGMDEGMKQKPTNAPIKNEAANGLKNEMGTLAMARTNVVDSATSQFFINVKDNSFLNHVDKNQFGYAVFGKVVGGMDVVNKIKVVPTTSKMGHENVPVTPVVIKSVKRK